MDARLRRARVFLAAGGLLFFFVFALPLLADPIWWAQRFGWETGGASDLTVYFGRCLGALALVISGMALWGARDPLRYRWLFDQIAIVSALLVIVHLRGTIEDSQPLIEHLETGGYALVGVAALACKPPSPDGERDYL